MIHLWLLSTLSLSFVLFSLFNSTRSELSSLASRLLGTLAIHKLKTFSIVSFLEVRAAACLSHNRIAVDRVEVPGAEG